MIFKLHYFLVTAGANAFSILLGVFIETYTDASPSELGALLMITPFLAMFGRPILCSIADRKQAHRKYLIVCLFVKILSYSPFIVIPFLGEQLYRKHARACWYILAALKVCGDLAAGGLASIADSLAINYANRVGTSFGVYRVWGTISWMLFGIIIGQVNEVWFLPKYVPAFMILIGSLALDAFLIWLWPREYFIMTEGQTEKAAVEDDEATRGRKRQDEESKAKVEGAQKCLMPRAVVWSQARAKLCRVFCCASRAPEAPPIDTESQPRQEGGVQQDTAPSRQDEPMISKMAQLRILGVLIQRDQRIIFYLAYFVLAGACQATMSFFFISLSKICHDQNSCDFSQLAGFLQFSMAALETVLFIYVKQIIDKIGRLNSAALAMLLSSAKFMFYGTIWTQVSPYYSLLSEGVTGVIYGINLTLMVEVGHLFSSEVKYIIHELLQRDIISADTEIDKLRYSLAATMQALVSSASEGIGTGCGSLIYGVLLERISYESLWFIIGLTCCACLLVLLSISTIDTVFSLKFGLDVRANDAPYRKESLEKVLQPDEVQKPNLVAMEESV